MVKLKGRKPARTSGTQEQPTTARAEFGAKAWGRWAWRQLTSMRTALILLFLLAVASIPGSLIPQRRVDPSAVTTFVDDHPMLADWYEKLGLFNVFGSPWFAAIYLALLVSLLGCIVPRSFQHWKAQRARPPAAPGRLERMPVHRVFDAVATDSFDRTSIDDLPAEATTSTAPTSTASAKGRPSGEALVGDGPSTEQNQDGDPTDETARSAVLEEAERVLRERRYRVVRDQDSVAAERGYLRETGNLVFHIAVVIVLIGVALGSLFGFKGTAIVVVGNGFANTITQYDNYEAGAFFEDDQLPPFSVSIDDFDVSFETGQDQRGSPRAFDADVTYTSAPGEKPQRANLTVNHPLQIDGAQVHLLSHGYAPRFTVWDGNGNQAYSGPWPFLQQDGNFTSTGVVKAPDASPRQLGFQGVFLPTTALSEERGPYSAFPDVLRPSVFLTAYVGDLGLDSGVPQSVYQLETANMRQLKQQNGQPYRVALEPGQTADLPGGEGKVRFDGPSRWVNLQVSRNPGEPIALVGAILALLGVTTSLFVKRRRAWVRVRTTGGRTVVEVAGLDRTEGSDDLATEIDELSRRLGSGVTPVGESDGTKRT